MSHRTMAKFRGSRGRQIRKENCISTLQLHKYAAIYVEAVFEPVITISDVWLNSQRIMSTCELQEREGQQNL